MPSAATLGYGFLPTHVRSADEARGCEQRIGAGRCAHRCSVSGFAFFFFFCRFNGGLLVPLGESAQTKISAKRRAREGDQMLHVLPRCAQRLVLLSGSSAFKNSLLAFAVFCDIIDSLTISYFTHAALCLAFLK